MKSLIHFLGSYGLAVALLGILFLLTLFGTFAQVHTSLYEVQAMYFNSRGLVHYLFGVVPLPLPGGVTVMTILAVNLLVGGFIRVRWSWRTAGVLVTHVGIALMLLAGLVKLSLAEEGHLTLYEGQRSNEYVSYYEWEVAIWDANGRADTDEYIIGHQDLIDLQGERVGKFRNADLPFVMSLSHFTQNARAMPKGPMWETPFPVVDGYALKEMPPEDNAEHNVAGMYVTTQPKDGGPEELGILPGLSRVPHTFDAGGKSWAVALRHRTYPMPYTIVLDKFTRDLHPGTGMASRFMSDVTMIDEKEQRPLEIEMNEPLREGGLVLFQASWGPSNAGPGDPLFSTFSVVRNPSDHWPLISLIITGIGLIYTFGYKLNKYIQKQLKKRKQAGPVDTGSVARAAGLLLAIGSMPLFLGGCKDEIDPDFEPVRTEAYSAETLELASQLTVQAGGRVKPLSTYAGFQLLKMNGKRKVVMPNGEKLNPVEWMLDCWFFPEDAVRYKTFLVEDSSVLVAAGIEGKKRRDKYSYEELAGGMNKLLERARATIGKDQKDLTSLERQTRALATNMRDFEDLIHFLDFARERFPADTTEGMSELFEGAKELTLSQVLAKSDELLKLWNTTTDEAEQAFAGRLSRALDNMVRQGGNSLAMIAPNDEWSSHPPHEGHDAHAEDDPSADIYMAPTELMAGIFANPNPSENGAVAMIARLEMMLAKRDQPAEFETRLREFHGQVSEAAAERDEFSKIPMEIAFYKVDYFYRGLVAFILSFLLLALSWILPDSKLLQRGIWGSIWVGTILLVAGIVMRCILRSRPPVSTLYETILFITACTILVSLFIEYFNRQRVALAVASTLGIIGLFLSMKYELKEAVTAGDTMPSLVAVLDTNFWLATHVTTVTMGYAAGLLAAAIAHVWIFGKILGFRRGDREFYQGISRTIYGVLCFGLLFSLIGTVLGGIWANYSWGRFWGWDPKENGALLICLAQLMILHARMGGYLKQFGLCVASILAGMVVAFSWWHVNLLGVGLHSYGFTNGIMLTLNIFYSFQLVVLLAGTVWWFYDRGVRSALAAQSKDFSSSANV